MHPAALFVFRVRSDIELRSLEPHASDPDRF